MRKASNKGAIREHDEERRSKDAPELPVSTMGSNPKAAVKPRSFDERTVVVRAVPTGENGILETTRVRAAETT